MRRAGLLKSIVVFQAICLIALSAFVISRTVPAYPSEEAGAPTDEEESPDGREQTDGSVVARVGSGVITEDEWVSELIRQYGDTVLRTMMIRRAIDLEAAKYGITVRDEEIEGELMLRVLGYGSEEAFYNAMKDQLGLTEEDVWKDARYRLLLEKIATRTISVTDKEIDDYLREYGQQFQGTTQYRLAWIVTDTYDEAERVLDLLEEGESFERLASEYSKDEFTADNGGDLGLVDQNDPFLDPALLEAAGRLEIGSATGPLKVKEGYAVVRLLEKREATALSGDLLREAARRQIALSVAKPLREVEEELLSKYAVVLKPAFQSGN